MSAELERLADAVLFEGYLLYPYRRSSPRDQSWWPFGTIYPDAFCRARGAGESSVLELQCLVRGGEDLELEGQLRFFQLTADGPRVRAVELSLTAEEARTHAHIAVQFDLDPLRGAIDSAWTEVATGVLRLSVAVTNTSPMPVEEGPPARGDSLRLAMASCHVMLTAKGGEFVSLIDPPAPLAAVAATCRGRGLWPVLVGEQGAGPGTARSLLAAPIILPDHPRIAPESPGDLFDGTEIDEILTLRILTLTDQEKAELIAGDPRARKLLERTLALPEESLRRLHGRLERRGALRPGVAVRLRPSGRGDLLDLALAGRRATVDSIERDLEGRSYVVVTVDDDPGRDLGAFGHRYFFRPDEVELL
ncbi:MAG TPA: hypothetical protein VKB80_04910 [Kofleriaceae bacterium]|nr:hypothetical protein [Kofleriaceae bacterium]